MTVFAYDLDAPHNARISYQLEPDLTAGREHEGDVDYFQLKNENSGEVTLIRPIPKTSDVRICSPNN